MVFDDVTTVSIMVFIDAVLVGVAAEEVGVVVVIFLGPLTLSVFSSSPTTAPLSATSTSFDY